MSEPYNPLARLNLARSIETEILARPMLPLAGLPQIIGAGIYALYYAGDFQAYAPLAASMNKPNPQPIYVGKAIPEGGRIGGLSTSGATSPSLRARLRKHSRSIEVTENLSVFDFYARFLVVDDIWIPLGENVLIERYGPVWNRVIAGFGNNPLGKGRDKQSVSLWDILHPGRETNVDAFRRPTTQTELIERVGRYFSGLPVPEVDERDIGGDEDEAETETETETE